MLHRVLTGVILVTVLGLLTLQRFLTPPELSVSIAGADGKNLYGFGENFRRGSTIKTADGFLEIAIGNAQEPREIPTRVWLSKNTTITLDRLYENNLIIRLTRGRIVAQTHAKFPLRIKTNKTELLLHDGTASFVNFDFLQTLQVIPIDGIVQTTIVGKNESMVSPIPLSIHEVDQVEYATLQVNLAQSEAKEFYAWTGVLTSP